MARNSYRSFLVISVTYISVMATAASFEWNQTVPADNPDAVGRILYVEGVRDEYLALPSRGPLIIRAATPDN